MVMKDALQSYQSFLRTQIKLYFTYKTESGTLTWRKTLGWSKHLCSC